MEIEYRGGDSGIRLQGGAGRRSKKPQRKIMSDRRKREQRWKEGGGVGGGKSERLRNADALGEQVKKIPYRGTTWSLAGLGEEKL